MKLSIVIPCYNEAENLPLILKRFSEVIGDRDIEVVLVNNGSTDNSAAVFEELLPSYTFAKLVNVPVNKGYGYGILQGLKGASGDYLGWTHADMQTDPADVVKAYGMIDPAYPRYIKGNRKGRPITDEFFTVGMSIFETIFLGAKVSDVNAQPNIFPRSFYESWDRPPYDFSLDLYAVYMASVNKLDMVRFPVRFPERIHGESKWNTGLKGKWKFIKRTLEFSVKLKRRLLRQKEGGR
ncbi:MAG: glycosyltransferase family 2 protein [Lachnospiraceae bacterium]|nr:glycosyltransferase family 2 protein [Lachnospiraceae bacterium]